MRSVAIISSLFVAVGALICGCSDDQNAERDQSAPNAVENSVTNFVPATLSGRTYTFTVTASQNIASSGPVISNNYIGGKLTCSGNTPAPVNNGQPNTVSGERVGQTCAAGTF